MERGLSVVGPHQGFRSCRSFLPYRPVAAHPLCFSGIDEIEKCRCVLSAAGFIRPAHRTSVQPAPPAVRLRGMALPLTASPSCPSPEYASALIPKACAGGVFLCRGTAREALPLPIAPPSGHSRNYNSTCTGAWIARLFSVTSQSSARTRTPAACAFWSAWPKAG